MVQDLECTRQANQFPESVPAINPVFSRTDNCRGECSDGLLETNNYNHNFNSQGNQTRIKDGQEEDTLKNLLPQLNNKVCQLLKCSNRLSAIDARTERITKPLKIYSNGIIFAPLNGGSFQANDSDQTISLNSEVVSRLIKIVPQKWRLIALLVFLCHEVSHRAQGIKHYEDVQRMKWVDEDIGRQRMGELDLRSDFLSVHTLSLFFTLSQYREYNHNGYILWFYEIWCKACRAMLEVFPVNNRKDKQQRIFGYLLMANLVRDAYESYRPLEFNGELWTEWSESLDRLSIYSNGEPFLPGSPVDSALMKVVLSDIDRGSYDSASEGIDRLWRSLPRR